MSAPGRLAVMLLVTPRERGDYCVEHRVVWSDGSIHCVEGNGSLRRDGDGRAVRMTGTVVGVTARKRAEAELSNSEQLLRHFIRHTPAAVAMFDDQCVTSRSPSAGSRTTGSMART